MFKVFYLTPGEFSQAVIMPGHKPAEFETLEEAKAFIHSQVNEDDAVLPRDNSNSATISYDVYDGTPFDEDGEVVKDPVYTSDDYYYHP